MSLTQATTQMKRKTTAGTRMESQKGPGVIQCQVARDGNTVIYLYVVREKEDLTQSYDKKSLHLQSSKKQRENTKTSPKTSIIHVQRLRTD